MNDLSILFVDQGREIAGGEVVMFSLIETAREKGFQVGVLAPMGGGLEAALVSRWGPRVARYDLKPLEMQNGRKGLGDLFRLMAYCFHVLKFWRVAAGYRVIYVNGGRLAPAFALLSLLLPMHRWFYHVHLCHSRVEKLLLAIISLIPTTDQIVMASSYIRDDYFRSLPWLKKSRRFVVLENCLDAAFDCLLPLDRFQPEDEPQQLTVALIGRVSPEKGHDVLPRLAKRFPSVRFLIIGRIMADQQDYFDSLFAEKLPNLIYLGETSRLPSLLDEQQVQFSIIPSRWEEPFGLTSIESMAASCITFVSSKGMLPLIAERTGALCFRDDDHLEDLLEKVFTLKVHSLQLLARNQYQSVHRHFSLNTFCWRFVSLIRGTSVVPA
jgi:glycosyltransferase involved in cell wall biosynthesis